MLAHMVPLKVIHCKVPAVEILEHFTEVSRVNSAYVDPLVPLFHQRG